MKKTRRTFLLGTAVLAALGVGGYAARSALMAGPAEPQPLRIPPLLDARKQDP